MTISKPYLTFLLNTFLALTGSTIAYLTGWLLVIPFLFGIGVPLINIENTIKRKLILTILISIGSFVVFMASITTLINIFPSPKYISATIVGIAGIMMLLINGLLIKSITINTKIIIMTFLLTGSSLPIWSLLTDYLSHKDYVLPGFLRVYGNMIFWMLMSTISFCIGEKNTATNNSYTQSGVC